MNLNILGESIRKVESWLRVHLPACPPAAQQGDDNTPSAFSAWGVKSMQNAFKDFIWNRKVKVAFSTFQRKLFDYLVGAMNR